MSERDDLAKVRRRVGLLADLPFDELSRHQRDALTLRHERDALAATVQRVRNLCAPRRCHQCDGTGQQEAGERHPGPRLVQSAPTTETCHLCSGAGAVEPLAVTVDDLRAALAPSDPATDTGGEGHG